MGTIFGHGEHLAPLKSHNYGIGKMKIRVYYEDTDAGGIVYHTNYIKYCERARSEIFFSKGILPTLDIHSGFVVRDLKANFLSYASLGDILEITTTMLIQKRSSISLLQKVVKKDKIIFTMEILLVYINKGKATRIPAKFQEIFK